MDNFDDIVSKVVEAGNDLVPEPSADPETPEVEAQGASDSDEPVADGATDEGAEETVAEAEAPEDPFLQRALVMGFDPNKKDGRSAKDFVQFGEMKAGYEEQIALLRREHEIKFAALNQANEIKRQADKAALEEKMLRAAEMGDMEEARQYKAQAEAIGTPPPPPKQPETPKLNPVIGEWRLYNTWIDDQNDPRRTIAEAAITQYMKDTGTTEVTEKTLKYIDFRVEQHEKKVAKQAKRGAAPAPGAGGRATSGAAKPKYVAGDLTEIERKIYMSQKDVWKDVNEFKQAQEL